MLKDFINNDGDNFIFTGNYLEMYIPAFYFESQLAENYGNALRVFGLFTIKVSDDKKKGGQLETFNVPSIIYIFPSELEKQTLQLINENEPEQYYVAKFYKGNKIMSNCIPQDATNVELFLDILFRGKIPKSIPYNQILEIWQKNLSINNVKLGVTSTILEVIISQIYRDKDKPEETFGRQLGKNPNKSKYAYKTAAIREICARNSTFAGLTFEDMDSMITSSLNINKYNKNESDSPVEKIIKM